jgi:hypothetical protein
MMYPPQLIHRSAYVLLGTCLGAIVGYVLAKHSVLIVAAHVHLWSPEQYSFEQMTTDVRNIRSWLCPLVAVVAGGYAAISCHRFGRPRRVRNSN